MLNKYIFVKRTLFLLLIVYFLQGLIYPSGSIISQTVLALYLVISLYFFIKVIFFKKKNFFIVGLTIFLFMIVFYYLISQKVHIKYDGESANTFEYLKGVCFAFLTFFPFYFLTKNNQLKSKDFIIFFYIFGVITIGRFFFFQALLQGENFAYNIENYNVVNNAAYDILSLFPFILLISDKKIFSNLIVLILFIVIMSSLKRGAIITAGVVLLIYFLYLIKSRGKIKLSNFLLAFIFLFVSGYLIYHFYLANEFFQNRFLLLSEGGYSNRDILYSQIFDFWKNSKNFFNLIFGYGLWTYIEINGNAAHNDWLELLSNCGIIGVLVYLSLFYLLYISAKKKKRIR